MTDTPIRTHTDCVRTARLTAPFTLVPTDWAPDTPVLVVAGLPEGAELRRLCDVPEGWEWQDESGRWYPRPKIATDSAGLVVCRPKPVPAPPATEDVDARAADVIETWAELFEEARVAAGCYTRKPQLRLLATVDAERARREQAERELAATEERRQGWQNAARDQKARADQAEAERDELRIAIHGGCGCPAPTGDDERVTFVGPDRAQQAVDWLTGDDEPRADTPAPQGRWTVDPDGDPLYVDGNGHEAMCIERQLPGRPNARRAEAVDALVDLVRRDGTAPTPEDVHARLVDGAQGTWIGLVHEVGLVADVLAAVRALRDGETR